MVEAQTRRLATGGRIAIAVGILAAAVAIAAVAIEHAYPGATTTTWRIIFFGSIAVAAFAVLYLVFDLVFRPRLSNLLSTRIRPNIQSIAASLFVIFALGGGLWYAASITPRDEPVSPPSNHDDTLLVPPILVPPIGQPSSKISRADKFIFACDIPPTPHQLEELQKQLKVLGEVIGFAVTVTDIEDGFKSAIEAETTEAKNRLISAGIIPSVTKVMVEIR
jgi:hypothetical protein